MVAADFQNSLCRTAVLGHSPIPTPPEIHAATALLKNGCTPVRFSSQCRWKNKHDGISRRVDFIPARCVSEGLLVKTWPLFSLTDVSGCENPSLAGRSEHSEDRPIRFT